MSSVLTVKSLNKSFSAGLFEKKRQVLFDINFALPEGLTSGFVGSNGSGKTTTIKCIFDFIHPQSGEILIFGQTVSSDVRKKIGYLPERPYLYEFLTAMEFLQFHWRLCHGQLTSDFYEKAHQALKTVDLYEARDRKLRGFSKGMLQRTGLAQAILNDPQLLILDEPMSGLDPDGRIMVKDILFDQAKKGVSIFFSSHLLQDMEELCKYLVVIDKGRIAYQGALSEFLGQKHSLEEAFRVMRKKGAQNG